MSIRKFRFVSPGIFVREVDNSRIPREPGEIGPVVIGRAERGPALRPVRVESFSEFVETFGAPIAGGGTGLNSDAWRDGNYSSPTYGAYAAQAYLRNSSGLTFVKLAGVDHADSTSGATKAGWAATAHNTEFGGTTAGSAPGAYGLFVAASASSDLDFIHAATFYVERGALALHGSETGDGTSLADTKAGMNVVIRSGANNLITLRHYDQFQSDGSSESVTGSGDTTPNGLVTDFAINFDENSNHFIRKKVNTNPTLTNSTITDPAGTSYRDFWLGQSFENAVKDKVGATAFSSTTAGDLYAVLMPLYQAAGTIDGGDWERGHTPGESGWVFSQNQGASGSLDTSAAAVLSGSQSIPVTKLFKFHSLYGGEWESSNIKVSIKDIKAPTNQFNGYGTFTVQVRRKNDTDSAPQVIEEFSNCNLNPSSPNYIAERIGDVFSEWDSGERRYKEYNNRPNQSRYIRVEMDSAVDAGQTEAALLPFGFYGPLKFVTETQGEGQALSSNSFANPAKAATPYSSSIDGFTMGAGGGDMTGSFSFPSHRLVSGNRGFANPTDVYFGVDVSRSGSGANSRAFAEDYKDLSMPLPGALDIHGAPATGKVYSFIFTLDDVKLAGSNNTDATYQAGYHASGDAYTSALTAPDLLDKGFDKFTVPLVGGWDGLDVRERDPFRNNGIGDNELTSYAYNSVKRSIDAASDPEVVDCNLMAVPGIYKEGLTKHLIDTAEARADALAIIDLDGDFKDSSEGFSAESSRAANVTTTVANLKARALNSSYGAAYFPWCSIRDDNANKVVSVPPSVIALGVLSYSQDTSELWFAPAGFTRGGLSENNAAGLPVVNVKKKLNSKDRDKLYEVNINPIADFPAEGIVVFGQKTLQVTPSALDRINVRRLMIYLEKEISRIAATILFDQNVLATWNRFATQADTFLRSVKTRFGVTDYKVVQIEKTTTPELIDRNILYARLFIKPARAIEFIALEFNITNSGASFEDL